MSSRLYLSHVLQHTALGEFSSQLEMNQLFLKR
jgi:hypothetical protein